MDERIIVGTYTYGHNNIRIAQYRGDAKVVIGKFCSISHCTIYLGGEHRPDWITTYPFGHINHNSFPVPRRVGLPRTKGDVVIGNDVWIGQGVTIMSGVKIGHGAVIGTNAHVVSNIKPYSVVGGNPAQFYYFRFDKETIKRLLELKWWDWDIERINKNIDLLCSNNIANFFKNN